MLTNETELNQEKYMNASEREPILNIRTTLLKQEEIKKYGNRLIEDGIKAI